MISNISPLQNASTIDTQGNHAAAAAHRFQHELTSAQSAGASGTGKSELREKFDSFVGESFYGQMLQAMHKTVGKPAYFNGGRAEEIFQGQLDQILSEKMTKANGSSLSESMFDLFNLQSTGGRR